MGAIAKSKNVAIAKNGAILKKEAIAKKGAIAKPRIMNFLEQRTKSTLFTVQCNVLVHTTAPASL